MSQDFLPNNVTKFERALVRDLSDTIETNIRKAVDPDQTSADFLPFLAGHESIDLWYPDWPIERKRLIIKQALKLASIKGTRAAVPAFLPFVDAVLLDRVSHPTRFVMGRGIIGRTPIGHKAFVARHLVKTETTHPKSSMVFGFTALGRCVMRTPSREKIKRALRAMTVAKAPDTESRVDFTFKRQIGLEHTPALTDEGFLLGGYVDRVTL